MNLHSGITVILTGGEIRSHKEALVGDIALRALEKVQANIAIMGCSGISAQHGISTNNIHEANVNARMIQNAHDLVIVVADHRKVGNDTNFNVTDLSHVDILITDTYANTQSIREIEEPWSSSASSFLGLNLLENLSIFQIGITTFLSFHN
ncbi:hypothetical protein MX850_01300 [Erysipelothrix sp. Poltava]|nr:hypothetical protein MX850_01300 [Erysipelothrix sp. Poltava]